MRIHRAAELHLHLDDRPTKGIHWSIRNTPQITQLLRFEVRRRRGGFKVGRTILSVDFSTSTADRIVPFTYYDGPNRPSYIIYFRRVMKWQQQD
jgi:hypothetical protein